MTFKAPAARIDPPRVASEREALAAWLDYHRETLLTKLDGLTEEQAMQRKVSTDTTLHGLVRHMTTLEQWSFVECVAGQKEPYAYWDGVAEDSHDWEVEQSDGLQADVDRYIAICARSREIVAAADLDQTIARPKGPIDVRWVMISTIAEYARHNGHADIIRELIDGTTGE